MSAACSKHRRTDVLPLHAELVSLLQEWLRGVPDDAPLFPRLARRRTWLMVKKDLARCGIPYVTAEGIADFHAAGRHTHITHLLRSGASLPETMKLARHTDVKMTMKYTQIGIDDQSKAVQGTRDPVYDPELVYRYWSQAGGNVAKAMRLAEEAGEKGVPLKGHTWGEYATKHAYQERFRQEQKEYREHYHAEREARQQHVLDRGAGTFEAVFSFFESTAVKHIENLESPVKLTRERAEAALMKMFGSMESVDRFYRMYLRARGEPEKITKQEHSGEIATKYGDLDEVPKASSPEEAKRIAEDKQ